MAEHIKIRFTEDQLFGPDPEATEGVDIAASIENYIATLAATLQREYPSSTARTAGVRRPGRKEGRAEWTLAR